MFKAYQKITFCGVLGWVVICSFFSSGKMALAEDERQSGTLKSGWSMEIEEALDKGDADRALQLTEQAIAAAPDRSLVHLMKGMVCFRLGRMEESILAFDRSIELDPRSAASCWQRGISLYYLERYAEGRDQFELHRTVNPNDVENSFWHFLCVAKLDGLEAARSKVLLSGYDSRVPLMDVLKLLQGTESLEDVIAATENAHGGPRGKAVAKFYGYLYVGLYQDLIGDKDAAKLSLQKSIETKVGGYMADVARIHLNTLGTETGK